MTYTNSTGPTDANPSQSKAALHLIDRAGSAATAGALDGAWWPGSRELAREVPRLVAEFAERGVRVTRFVYQPSLWLIAPAKLRVKDQTVRLAWRRGVDPNLVSVQTAQDERIDLLVIPPEATPGVAAYASEAATEVANRQSPTNVLLAAAALDEELPAAPPATHQSLG